MLSSRAQQSLPDFPEPPTGEERLLFWSDFSEMFSEISVPPLPRLLPRGLLLSGIQRGVDGRIISRINSGIDRGINRGINRGTDPGMDPGIDPGMGTAAGSGSSAFRPPGGHGRAGALFGSERLSGALAAAGASLGALVAWRATWRRPVPARSKVPTRSTHGASRALDTP